MIEPCIYCGGETGKVGSSYTTRITGHPSAACPGICRDLQNAEMRTWVGLQYSTMCVPKVRHHVLTQCFSQFTADQLGRLVSHEGQMHLHSHSLCESDHTKDIWERDWCPIVIAFGVDRLKELWESGFGGGVLGYDDAMAEDGFDPKTKFDGHDAWYAFEMSTPKEIRKVAREILEKRQA